ncbi:nucleic acid-binding protein [Candidatus Bathyarchaeota archaeon]|nr:Zn-ribbon domain-containing OB-fold protein [Candidatus Bathyarchaeota archaeon]NIR14653.1 Zn-ribbon domain-containing OB-fold protein [Desulfobacterales bacterium]NIU81769.1 nucleic acid-binding protein [Candidatus Bathyarchaeota archaeon]NIV67838.1 nucleic acid-binding protein [Candidatus Bathyarchaeota archaeon]NIW16628.1 nucleic acid-binding protein [Candidatus Bathyarchaeota archaeon]
MSTEKIGDPREIRHWLGHMEADYAYTRGIAGDRFFKEIQEKGRIMGAECEKCGLTYVPPRLFCERCFEKLDNWVELGKRGVVHTYTVSHIDIDGSELKKPIIWAVIKIDNAHGGLVHKLGETSPEDVYIGMQVEAIFRDRKERQGSMLDIKYFKPTG